MLSEMWLWINCKRSTRRQLQNPRHSRHRRFQTNFRTFETQVGSSRLHRSRSPQYLGRWTVNLHTTSTSGLDLYLSDDKRQVSYGSREIGVRRRKVKLKDEGARFLVA